MTAEHKERLTEYGAHAAQGYLLSRPLAPDVLGAWLARQGLRVRADRASSRLAK